MTGIANYKTNVVALGKFDSGGNIGGAGDIDRIVDVVTKQTWLLLGSEGVTTLVGKVWLHDRGGRVQTVICQLAWAGNKGVCKAQHTVVWGESTHPAGPHKRRHRSWDRGKASLWGPSR